MEKRFWELFMNGVSVRHAAAVVGVAPTTAQRWVTRYGGVIPRQMRTATTGRYLSPQERIDIGTWHFAGVGVREIAARLKRSPSTISRELRRNSTPLGYQALIAMERAHRRARRPKPRRLQVDGPLRDQVQAMLREKLSPEQISAVLRIEFRDDPEMQISHESIYQAIYVQGRGQLRRELAACLRTGRAVRRPKKRGAPERRGRIPGMVNISQRPAEVSDRAVPGHWEGDLIIGRNSGSAIGTLVERSTRYLMLLHLPNGHSADAVRDEMIRAIKLMPTQLRKTLTWDQGTEMTRHAEIKTATDMDIYFCDPRSPWQRGSNENTNGLLRQYFPKGTNLNVHSRDHLDFVANQMNHRPRKTLDWQNPAQRLNTLLSQPPELPAVATTD